ncbi:hypothetical protein V6U86_33030 [Micromonospora sp. CPCC 205558]
MPDAEKVLQAGRISPVINRVGRPVIPAITKKANDCLPIRTTAIIKGILLQPHGEASCLGLQEL